MYRKFSMFNFINYTFFCIFIVIMIYPLWYVLMYSISKSDARAFDNYFILPEGFSLAAYAYIIKQPFLKSGFYNSTFVTVVGTLLSLLLTTITAYPLSRPYLVGKKYIFGMIIFTMLFNGGMIPTFLVVRAVGLLDSLWAMILPGAISVYNMLIMIKFFKQIPSDLIDSAKVDGLDDISTLFFIVLPISQAVLATIGLFYAVGYWGSYLPGVLYINDMNKRVLQVIIRSMLMQDSLAAETTLTEDYVTPENIKMAAVILTMLPILLVYPFLQRYFVKGVMLGAVKG